MRNKVHVKYHGKMVGTIGMNDRGTFFQYDLSWQQDGFSISPFSLPLSDEIFMVTKPYFDGLFGVFGDSLPDAWGKLLFDRYIKKHNIKDINVLDRLCFIGSSGMGGLEYYPDNSEETVNEYFDLDVIASECSKLLNNEESEILDGIYRIGSSAGGARPKILMKYNDEPYIVKFRSKYDPVNIGNIEYEYMKKAKELMINVPDFKMIETDNGKYFAVKRFDRNKDRKIHMISAAALLETDYRAPSLDYDDLLKMTKILTRNKRDVEQMYRRMVFNVVFENMDDHAKNFSYLYDEEIKMYRLSPAYDLTKGETYYGEHTTSVNGKGKDIADEDMIVLGTKYGIDKKLCRKIIEDARRIKNV